jgi:Ca2+-binding RTX toxin-like protein
VIQLGIPRAGRNGVLLSQTANGVLVINGKLEVPPHIAANLTFRGTDTPHGELVHADPSVTYSIRFEALGGKDNFIGGSGADIFDGGEGDDHAVGGPGDDVLDGGGGDDRAFGAEGNDQLRGGQGHDYVEGGAGDDVIDVGPGENAAYGMEGNDVLLGGDRSDYFNGGAGDDRLEGGAGVDQLFGLDGDDTLNGGEGNDVLAGGEGANALDPGPGDDKIFTALQKGYSGNGDNDMVWWVDGATTNAGGGKPGSGLKIDGQGDAEFVRRVEDDLDALRSTPLGRTMLTLLDDTGQSVVIAKKLDPVGGSSARALDHAAASPNPDGTPGLGSGAIIEYSHDDVRLYSDSERRSSWAFGPPVLILLHEMVHAYTYATGTRDEGETLYGPETVRDLEAQATGLPYDHDENPNTVNLARAPHPTENDYRSELNLPMRTQYGKPDS